MLYLLAIALHYCNLLAISITRWVSVLVPSNILVNMTKKDSLEAQAVDIEPDPIASRLTNLRLVWFVLKSTIANAHSSLCVGELGVHLAVLHQRLIGSGNGQLQTRMGNRSLPKLSHPSEVECGAEKTLVSVRSFADGLE